MGEPQEPTPEPATMAELMGLSHLEALGVPPEGLAALLAFRRAVRGTGQPEGTGGQSIRERLRW